MVFSTQVAFWLGGLLLGIITTIAFILGFKVGQERENQRWQEEWRRKVSAIEAGVIDKRV